jgi:hypothetical protein
MHIMALLAVVPKTRRETAFVFRAKGKLSNISNISGSVRAVDTNTSLEGRSVHDVIRKFRYWRSSQGRTPREYRGVPLLRVV